MICITVDSVLCSTEQVFILNWFCSVETFSRSTHFVTDRRFVLKVRSREELRRRSKVDRIDVTRCSFEDSRSVLHSKFFTFLFGHYNRCYGQGKKVVINNSESDFQLKKFKCVTGERWLSPVGSTLTFEPFRSAH